MLLKESLSFRETLNDVSDAAILLLIHTFFIVPLKPRSHQKRLQTQERVSTLTVFFLSQMQRSILGTEKDIAVCKTILEGFDKFAVTGNSF